MTIRRIVANLPAANPALAQAFYGDFLGLDMAMDLGFITTFAPAQLVTAQISLARGGGSDTALPAVSIEVDDVDALYARAQAAGFEIVYGITDEPWGVRRFYVHDPFGNVVNILSHSSMSPESV